MSGQYSEHRRPPAVPKVGRIERFDSTGVAEIRKKKQIEDLEAQADARAAEPASKPRRSFAALIKKKK